MAHEYRRTHQKKYLQNLIANVSREELIFLIDFSENYTCKYGTEVHSVHFGASRTQCTLHTGMFYTSGLSKGFATLSESLRHDPSAIMAHLKKKFDSHLPRFPTVNTIHFISDGPTTQYRNSKMFYLITQHLPRCYPQVSSISYNFTEAGHGKGAADGIGGCLKKQADDQVKYGHDIPDFKTFVETLFLRVKNTHLDTVTKADIDDVDTKLSSETHTFVGTMKVHQYTWSKTKPTEVFFNSLSCSECAIGTECAHFFLGNLSFETNSKKVVEKGSIRKRKAQCEKNDAMTSKTSSTTETKKSSISENTPLRKSLR